MDGMMWPMWALWLSWALAVVVLILAAAALGKYLFASNKQGNRDQIDKTDKACRRRDRPPTFGVTHLAAAMLALLLFGSVRLAAAEAPANFIIHPAAKAVPEIAFADERGNPLSLKDVRGRFVLLNIWATWCGPCRKEMPSLDRLQAQLGSDRFQVVALSIDRGGAAAGQKFYAETGVRHLAFFIDSTGRAGSTLGLIGLPGTLLIDPQGREIARLIGPAEWDSPKMLAFLQSQISRTDPRRTSTPQSATPYKETGK